MRSACAACATTPPVMTMITAAAAHRHENLFVQNRVITSEPDRQRHVQPPERKTLAAETRAFFARAIDAAKVSHIPTHPETPREEPRYARAEIHRLQIAERLQLQDRARDVMDMHEPSAANE